ncbi:HNH endonuclease family protein [Flexivirga caeni]|uniref:HNH endonuclease n=1 Tax=Flexivirga caeni TaxID=2294115 RepID=A0A3M9LV45_9MICO|nr:HNH endonuclease family protein [Flexivirga caeni]RNI17199.1 HNH endonuclease [Flexivirga caeni]
MSRRSRIASCVVLLTVACALTVGAFVVRPGGGRARATPVQVPAAVWTQLSSLPVKGRAPKTGYARSRFGQAWSDDVAVAGGHNGCDTRNDILARDLKPVRIKPDTHNCIVLSGTLDDPYTGRKIEFRRGASSSGAVQIDHLVALSDAWQTGAQQLTSEQRLDFANDPANLLAVDGPANQQKGAGDAATWLPSNHEFRCAYVMQQIRVKSAYHLWVTPAEHDAMSRVLHACEKGTQ